MEEGDDYRFVRVDIADRQGRCAPKIDEDSRSTVVHFAAESHVDRSIDDASAFLRTNVIGTQILIDLAREHGRRALPVHVSTDEVYGTSRPGGALHRGDAAAAQLAPTRPARPPSDLAGPGRRPHARQFPRR